MAEKRPFELVEEVQTPQDFIAFVHALLTDYQTNEDDWENPTLDRFLEALASWTEDWFNKHGEPAPPAQWSVFAQALLAASMYE